MDVFAVFDVETCSGRNCEESFNSVILVLKMSYLHISPPSKLKRALTSYEQSL